MAILALDVGTRRIGTAVSDPGETFALPLRTIERTSVHDDLAAILDLAAEYAARTIVVGEPVALDGARGIASQNMAPFVAALSKAFSGTVERVDERMTTAQATKTLIAADVSRKKRKGVVDNLAAALILESFLARRRAASRG